MRPARCQNECHQARCSCGSEFAKALLIAGQLIFPAVVVWTRDRYPKMPVLRGLEGDRHGARAAHRDRHIATRRGDGGESSERLAGCSGTIVVDPGLFEHAHPIGSRGVRLTGLPEPKCGSLGHVWICARHVDHQRIGRYLNVRHEADTTAVLDQRSVVQIETAAEILGRSKCGEAGNDELARRIPMRQRICAVQLGGESVRSPHGDAQPSVAHRHRFARLGVWLAQHNVRSAQQPGGIYGKMSAPSMRSSKRVCRPARARSAAWRRGREGQQDRTNSATVEASIMVYHNRNERAAQAFKRGATRGITIRMTRTTISNHANQSPKRE